jgi:capsular exopolysaccharide synthesis family protein
MADVLGAKDALVLAERQKMAYELLGSNQKELIQVQANLRAAKLEKAFLELKKKAAQSPPSEAVINDVIAKHPELVVIQQELDRLNKKIREFRDSAKNPEEEKGFKDAQRELEEAKQKLDVRRTALAPGIREQLTEQRLRETLAAIAMIDERIWLMEEMEKQLRIMVESQLGQNLDYSKKANDLEWIKEEIAQIDEITKRIGAKVQLLQIEMRAPDRVRDKEPAIVSPPIEKKARTASMAGFAILGLVVAGITFLEYRIGKVCGADDVVGRLKMKIMGRLPILPRSVRTSQARPGKDKDSFWRNLLGESIDSTRTMVVHAAHQEGLQVIMVTSALGGEGKTMLSSHLVASLARAGKKTVLLDCDLRRPSVHRVFNMPLGPGLSELLRGEATLPDVAHPGPIDHLCIITAGVPDARAVQALSLADFPAVIARLREAFDFVIIDSAPILPVNDSQMVGQCADGVLLTIMQEVSRLPAVEAAYERLDNLHIRILGAVMHGGSAASYYGNSYRYLRSESAKPEAEKPEAEKPEDPEPSKEAGDAEPSKVQENI